MNTQIIKIDQIQYPENMLRDAQRKNKNWPAFVASINNDGQKQPIIVDETLQLIDGQQRLSALIELKKEEVLAIVDPNAKWSDSIVTNIHRFSTSKSDLAKYIKANIKDKTFKEIAGILNIPESQVLSIFNVSSIDESILEMVDSGEMSYTNAIALDKAFELCETPAERDNFVRLAKELTTEQLQEAIKQEKKRKKEENNSVSSIMLEEYNHITFFDEKRFQDEKNRLELLEESAELDDEAMDDRDRYVLDFVHYVYHQTEQDRSLGYEQWKLDHEERLKKARDKESRRQANIDRLKELTK